MSNPTHRKRIARRLAATSGLTYQQALTSVIAAQSAGALSRSLDDLDAAAAAVRDWLSSRPAAMAPARSADLLFDPDTLFTHALLVGETGCGRTVADRVLSHQLLALGWDGAILDCIGDGHGPGSLGEWAICHGAPDASRPGHGSVPGADLSFGATSGLSYISGPGPIAAAFTALTTLAATRSRTEGRVAPRFCLVSYAELAPFEQLRELSSRARAARVAMLVSTSGPSFWEPAHWAWLTSMTGARLVMRHREAADEVSALLETPADDEGPDVSPGAVRSLENGTALVRSNGDGAQVVRRVRLPLM